MSTSALMKISKYWFQYLEALSLADGNGAASVQLSGYKLYGLPTGAWQVWLQPETRNTYLSKLVLVKFLHSFQAVQLPALLLVKFPCIIELQGSLDPTVIIQRLIELYGNLEGTSWSYENKSN